VFDVVTRQIETLDCDAYINLVQVVNTEIPEAESAAFGVINGVEGDFPQGSAERHDDGGLLVLGRESFPKKLLAFLH
jgi:hypothetical protein